MVDRLRELIEADRDAQRQEEAGCADCTGCARCPKGNRTGLSEILQPSPDEILQPSPDEILQPSPDEILQPSIKFQKPR